MKYCCLSLLVKTSHLLKKITQQGLGHTTQHHMKPDIESEGWHVFEYPTYLFTSILPSALIPKKIRKSSM